MEKIKAVVVKAGEPAKIEEVENSLAGWYETIECDRIECIYPFDGDVCIIADEEGKINGSKPNRTLRDGDGRAYDVIFGTFVIVGYGKDADFRGLTDNEAESFRKLFAQPEDDNDLLEAILLTHWF